MDSAFLFIVPFRWWTLLIDRQAREIDLFSSFHLPFLCQYEEEDLSESIKKKKKKKEEPDSWKFTTLGIFLMILLEMDGFCGCVRETCKRIHLFLFIVEWWFVEKPGYLEFWNFIFLLFFSSLTNTEEAENILFWSWAKWRARKVFSTGRLWSKIWPSERAHSHFFLFFLEHLFLWTCSN